MASSCGEKPKKSNFFKLKQDFLDYAYFKTGSYWIYKDSVTGELDTHTVIYDEIIDRANFLNDNPENDREEMFISDVSRTYSNDVVVVQGQNCWEGEEHRPNVHCGWVDMAGPLGNVDICRFKPVINHSNTNGTVTAFYMSFLLDSIEYTEVQVLHIASNKVDSGFRTYIYFAGGIGIVKKRIFTRPITGPHYWRVWQLTDYQIVQ